MGLFTPDRAFDMVTKAQISKLKAPSIKLVDLVCVELMSISRDITNKVDYNQQEDKIMWGCYFHCNFKIISCVSNYR